MTQEELNQQLLKEIENQLLLDALEEQFNNENEEKDKDDVQTVPKKRRKITSKKKSKLKKRLAADVKFKTVALLILTLVVNTYAWFIYVSRVTAQFDIHVDSWNFSLSQNGQSTNNIELRANIHPGMQNVATEVDAANNGEVQANLSFNVLYIKIFDEIYVSDNEYLSAGETATQTNLTNEQLMAKLKEYPFDIKIKIITGSDDNSVSSEYTGQDVIMNNKDKLKVRLECDWPYETVVMRDGVNVGDELDTYWGEKAYAYYQEHPDDTNSVLVKLEIKATQVEG